MSPVILNDMTSVENAVASMDYQAVLTAEKAPTFFGIPIGRSYHATVRVRDQRTLDRNWYTIAHAIKKCGSVSITELPN